MGLLKRIRAAVFRLTEAFFRKTVLTNASWYGRYHGTDARWILWIKNLMHPASFLTKLAYRQVLPQPFFLSRAVPPGASSQEGGLLDEEARRAAATLEADGVLILPARFAAEARRVSDQYGLDPAAFNPASHYVRTIVNPSDDESVLGFFLNEFLLLTFKHYYGCQPFFRHLPAVNISYPMENSSSSGKVRAEYAVDWHYDTPNLVSAHLLINDVPPEGTRMLFARGSHRIHHRHLTQEDANCSDAYIRDHYEIVPCCGPAGTLVVFDNNGWHRIEMVKESLRIQMGLFLTPGNALIPTKNFGMDGVAGNSVHPNVAKGFSCDPSTLSPLQRNALKGIAEFSGAAVRGASRPEADHA